MNGNLIDRQHDGAMHLVGLDYKNFTTERENRSNLQSSFLGMSCFLRSLAQATLSIDYANKTIRQLFVCVLIIWH